MKKDGWLAFIMAVRGARAGIQNEDHIGAKNAHQKGYGGCGEVSDGGVVVWSLVAFFGSACFAHDTAVRPPRSNSGGPSVHTRIDMIGTIHAGYLCLGRPPY